ncbi:MAG: hypothetical protein KDD73_15780 [Anaerolineales bacterium]|nr:hypothetical protein [Anaerolineales bacterium]MCB9127633.1 hypothetical protein [Ardenticatenales bacterium]
MTADHNPQQRHQKEYFSHGRIIGNRQRRTKRQRITG